MNKVRIYTTMMKLFFLLVGLASVGQNVQFTQYGNSSLLQNPALVGASGDFSGSMQNRSYSFGQFSKYTLTSLQISRPVLDRNKSRQVGGWGVSFLKEGITGNLDFSTQGISLAYASTLRIRKLKFIALGLSSGAYQRNFQTGKYTTSSQWSSDHGFVSDASTGEVSSGFREGFVTVAAGTQFYSEDTDFTKRYSVGTSVYNLNQPTLSGNTKNKIPMRFLLHGNYRLYKSDVFMVNGEVFYTQENYFQLLNSGVRFSIPFNRYIGFDPRQGNWLEIKLGTRWRQSITSEVLVRMPDFTFAFGYEMGVQSEESIGRANDATEFFVKIQKFIGVKRPDRKSRKSASYASMEEVRNFYFDQENNSADSSMAKNIIMDTTRIPIDTAQLPGGGFKVRHDFKFGFNDAQLNSESKLFLDDMVAVLKADTLLGIEIIGHTDDVGSPAANKNVSFKRANVVKEYLITQGIAADRILATAASDHLPLTTNDTEDGRALNRRVEFVLFK